MGHMGQRGKLRPKNEITFDWFDVLVHVDPNVTDVVVAEGLAELAELDENDPRAWTVARSVLQAMVLAEDWEPFWAATLRERQQTTDLMELMGAIVEEISDRPTGQPAGSSGGPTRTATSSEPASASAVLTALPSLRDRPDKQAWIVRRNEQLQRERLAQVSG